MLDALDHTPRSARPRTPALNHLLSHDGVAGVLVDRSRILALTTAVGLSAGLNALASASSESRVTLLPAIWATLLNTATIMAPSERLIHDSAWSLHVGDTLELCGVETLTARGATAYAAARKAAGPIFAPRPDVLTPNLTVQLGLSLRALLAEGGKPGWTAGAATELVNEGGALALLYLATGSLSRTFAALAESVLRLPDSLSAVVAPKLPGDQDDEELRGALIATTDSEGALIDDEYSREFIGPVEEGMAAYTRQKLGARTRHDLVFGAAVTDLLDPEQGLPPRANIEGTVQLVDLSQELGLYSEELDRLAANYGQATFRSESDHGTLASVVRFAPIAQSAPAEGAAAPAPLTVPLIGGASAPPTATSASAVCLEAHTAAAARYFQGLVNLAPEDRNAFIAQSTDAMATHLACARQDPATVELASLAEASLLYLTANMLDLTGDEATAMAWADRGCALLHAPSCKLAGRLHPAWPEGTLVLPTTAAPLLDAARDEDELEIAVGSEGIYVARQRVADPDGAATGAVARAVKTALDARPDLRLGLHLDQGAPFTTLMALVQLAEELDLACAVRLQSPARKTGTWLACLGARRPLARRANPREVWLSAQPTEVVLTWYADSGKLQSATVPVGPTMDLQLARTLAASFPRPEEYLEVHLHAHDALTLQQLGALLGAIYTPRGLSLEGATTLAGALERLDPSAPILYGLQPGLTLSAAPFSLAPKK